MDSSANKSDPRRNHAVFSGITQNVSSMAHRVTDNLVKLEKQVRVFESQSNKTYLGNSVPFTGASIWSVFANNSVAISNANKTSHATHYTRKDRAYSP